MSTYKFIASIIGFSLLVAAGIGVLTVVSYMVNQYVVPLADADRTGARRGTAWGNCHGRDRQAPRPQVVEPRTTKRPRSRREVGSGGVWPVERIATS